MSSWDEKPIVSKYTKKLMGIVEEEDTQRENSTLSIEEKSKENKRDKSKESNEPTKRKQVQARKKSYEYPYARKLSKEGTIDSLKSESSDLALHAKTKNEILLNNVKKKFSYDEQPLMVQTPNKIVIKQKSPDRKPVKLERLQRLYEDEFLARKPIRFNSFDMFEDKIGVKKDNKNSSIFRETSLDSIDTHYNAKNKTQVNPKKYHSFSSIQHISYGNNLLEDENESNNDEDEDDDGDSDEYEDEIIEIRRFRTTPRPSIIALSTTSSNSSSSTPTPLTYEYKSPRVAALNLPPLIPVAATQPLPVTPITAAVPIPAVVPVAAAVPISTTIPTVIPTPLPRSNIPVPITTIIRPNLIQFSQASLPPKTPPSRRRTVRFNSLLDEDYPTNFTTKVDFNENKNDDVMKKKQPNLHMKPVKSILRNKLFAPDTSFSVN